MAGTGKHDGGGSRGDHRAFVWLLAGVVTAAAAAGVLQLYGAKQQQQQQSHGVVFDFVPEYPADAAALKSLLSSKEKAVAVGNRTSHPSFGIFPRGCKWREVTTEGSKHVEYQYWDAAAGGWSDQRPLGCTVRGSFSTSPQEFSFHKGTPRSEAEPHKHYFLYRNLWYNNGRWYALVDGDAHVPSWKFSRNQEIVTLHVDDAATFLDSVKWRLVRGDTLLFDFIYFIHPTAIGHWWEMLGPLYSILKKTDIKLPCDQLVLMHLKRCHFMEWVRGGARGGAGGGGRRRRTRGPWGQRQLLQPASLLELAACLGSVPGQLLGCHCQNRGGGGQWGRRSARRCADGEVPKWDGPPPLPPPRPAGARDDVGHHRRQARCGAAAGAAAGGDRQHLQPDQCVGP
jgi:hypothetical protein